MLLSRHWTAFRHNFFYILAICSLTENLNGTAEKTMANRSCKSAPVWHLILMETSSDVSMLTSKGRRRISVASPIISQSIHKINSQNSIKNTRVYWNNCAISLVTAYGLVRTRGRHADNQFYHPVVPAASTFSKTKYNDDFEHSVHMLFFVVDVVVVVSGGAIVAVVNVVVVVVYFPDRISYIGGDSGNKWK